MDASLDTVALYARILALVQPQELHRSSNVVLHEEFSTLHQSVTDVVAVFAKVEEVRDAVNQLEQGKPSSGRSASLMEAMDSTMTLQKELQHKLKKVAAEMKVTDVEGGERDKRKRTETEDESSSSDSSSSSEEEEEQTTQKKQKQEQLKTSEAETEETKRSADLQLAHRCLKVIFNVRAGSDMTDKWTKAISDIKLILKHQSRCDAHTTDNPAAEVTARSLEAAVVVFRKMEWTVDHVKEVKSLIAALTEACSKNEVLRFFFHRVRAELESLEMTIPSSLAAKVTDKSVTTKSLGERIQYYHELIVGIQSLRGSDQSKCIVEALSVMREVMADDITRAHQHEVRSCVENVRCWISELPLRNELDKEYVRYVNSLTEYSKKMHSTNNRVGWQRLATAILASLDEKRQQYAKSSPSLAASKKTKEHQDRLKALAFQVDQWQDGIFSLDQLDKLMKALDDIVSYKAKDWDPLADPTTNSCVEKLRHCIRMIKKQAFRDKRLNTVNKWTRSIKLR